MMPEFTYKWGKFSGGGATIEVKKAPEAPIGTSGTPIVSPSSKNLCQRSPDHSDVRLILDRLIKGQRWLTDQLALWEKGNPKGASDDRFSVALQDWDILEGELRRYYGFTDWILGPGERCPKDAPVSCDACCGG
jgi:hypothetical protein